MFKKFLARFGKGAATVDLRFENRPYFAGETIHGEVHIHGGEVEQKINHASARFMMSVATKQGTATREVAVVPLSGAYSILAKEQKVIPFTYQIPTNLPVSRGSIAYYFDTQLDIEGGVDRTDVDRLIVEAPKRVQSIFRALEGLGFREKPNSGKVDQYGQEFAFFPTHLFAGHVSEVELRFSYEETGVYIWMEIDCRSGYQEIEAKREFFLEDSILQNEERLAELLHQYITESVEHPYSYTQPFSYASHYGHASHHSHGHHHGGSSLGGMIGGLALGILGGVLMSEMLDALGVDEMVDEMIEDTAEAFGFDGEDEGEEDEGGFGDFFGGDDEEM
ncbi:sporulation protein [Bacillus sp. OTU530]|uniref:sporulation protein n=1 Tax=Bacillus sp. OTU530 TaxID=3043862 RepID=UPI00313ED70C